MLFTLFLFISSVFASSITSCNECNASVVIPNDLYDISYTLCTFDTTLSASTTNANWIIIGTQCDDRCDGNPTIAEGYLCTTDYAGYFEVEDNMITEQVFNKLDFHHFKCNVTNDMISAHTHRFMPNAWIKNVSVTYYIASGNDVTNLTIDRLSSFDIIY